MTTPDPQQPLPAPPHVAAFAGQALTYAIVSLFLPVIGLALAGGALSMSNRVLREYPHLARAHTANTVAGLSLVVNLVVVVLVIVAATGNM